MKLIKYRIKLVDTSNRQMQYVKTRAAFRMLDVEIGGRLDTPFILLLEDQSTPIVHIPILIVEAGSDTEVDRTWIYIGSIEGNTDNSLISVFYKNEPLQ